MMVHSVWPEHLRNDGSVFTDCASYAGRRKVLRGCRIRTSSLESTASFGMQPCPLYCLNWTSPLVQLHVTRERDAYL
jgi:hypothetical protein